MRTNQVTRALRRAEQLVFVARQRDLEPHTMIGIGGMRGLTRLIDVVVDDGVPGAFVETGCWRGGASFLAARRFEARRDSRAVWMFDSFEGLPEPSAVDGVRAVSWADSPDGRRYDNCSVDVEVVETLARSLRVSGHTNIVKGWFDDTLKAHRDAIGPIAVLRIDCDWYSSVRMCLEELFDLVSPGGYVIFDDYDSWPGCALAVHEFLSERKLGYPIKRLGDPYLRIPAARRDSDRG